MNRINYNGRIMVIGLLACGLWAIIYGLYNLANMAAQAMGWK